MHAINWAKDRIVAGDGISSDVVHVFMFCFATIPLLHFASIHVHYLALSLPLRLQP